MLRVPTCLLRTRLVVKKFSFDLRGIDRLNSLRISGLLLDLPESCLVLLINFTLGSAEILTSTRILLVHSIN